MLALNPTNPPVYDVGAAGLWLEAQKWRKRIPARLRSSRKFWRELRQVQDRREHMRVIQDLVSAST